MGMIRKTDLEKSEGLRYSTCCSRLGNGVMPLSRPMEDGRILSASVETLLNPC